ncbi:5-hydroxytryptamine receptor 1E-like [Branchiostoma lanceolatum]|uniref:5-hydroxytryptamine receptor 1E-like n=1 Tax=Branchiostoma lanceolatum TaxID=7740 RepID=UPI003456914D
MAANSSNGSFDLANSTAFDWEPFYHADPPYRELQMVWLTACTVLGVCGNMALLITVSCVQELRTPGNALLCALAVADILQLVTKVPPSMIFLLHGKPLACDGIFVIIDTVYMTMAQFSVNIIAPISIDRYWYICDPLKYSNTMTSTRTALLIGLTFLIAMITMVHPLFEGWNNYFNPPLFLCKYLGPARKSRQAMINICIALTVIIMLFCYCKIWRELKRRQQSRINPETRSELEYGETIAAQPISLPGPEAQHSPTTMSEEGGAHDESFVSPFSPEENTLTKHQPCVPAISLSEVVSQDVTLNDDQDRQDQISMESAGQPQPQPAPLRWAVAQHTISPEFRARMRTATMVLLIVVAYVVSWTPYFAVLIRSNALGDEVSTATDGRWQRFAVLFSLLSTFSNPIIYAYRNPQLREGFFGLVRRRSL